ncbi:hypothetical protein OOK31_05865 [Streptomyces sp. NBC_00249]|uniref:hypothetical protein n=1 Tax=Streptomyces sp. NBC_00249 TaxID=2975690 RepID=UPI002256837D|nr:hypothetical protein [Streptomyces sp. NBC_00249]MCX5193419.1 hypothetical protein [Streptomyces sp. NBC_00249]
MGWPTSTRADRLVLALRAAECRLAYGEIGSAEELLAEVLEKCADLPSGLAAQVARARQELAERVEAY